MQKLIFNIENKDFNTIISQIESKFKINISGVVKNNKKYCGTSVKTMEGNSNKAEIYLFDVSDVRNSYKEKEFCYINTQVFNAVCQNIIDNL